MSDNTVPNSNTKKYVIGGLIFSLVIMVWMYNSLINAQGHAQERWSRIEAALQKQYELIPNLVEVAKAESKTMPEIARLQSLWAEVKSTGDQSRRQEAAIAFDAGWRQVMTVVQQRPEFKANRSLMIQLAECANEVKQERVQYGRAATVFNTKLRRFPNNIFAGFGDFERMKLFEAEADAKQAPKVNMG